ncbi:hypothetical protein SteCoe_4028 [Stentor coeruleus]|uniref:RING-type domain-containing protein n=1 Tax=Stentor coeruleus TaxID=5963 RepID=A0A1R2CVP9_9CILI|nr:hypothetical protein SteCoe_4028 [Stentor coeruleus]
MGNNSQRPSIVEVQIGTFTYPESRKATMGIFPFTLTKKPKSFSPIFSCSRCGRENFDGSLCQKVMCPCGSLSSRQGTEEVSPSVVGRFWDCFEICNSKRYAEVTELDTLNIGIFERGIPNDILQSSTLDFNAVFKEYLHPYFTDKLRCIGNKDFFTYNNCYFKVLNCNPEQGFVTRKTKIFCYKMLSDRNIFKIEVTPLAPHSISEEVFESLVLPYFRSIRHIHEDQLLSINGLECVVSKSEPWNGLITQDSQVEYNSLPMPQLERIKMVPYFEDIPNSLKYLDANTLVQIIVNCYLMPHLKGWCRSLYPGKTLSIAGIEFKVLETIPSKGIVSGSTIIFYDGKGISRREERRHQRSSAPRNNRLILRQILTMLDSMRALTEEINENYISTLPIFVLDSIPSSMEQKSCLICMYDFDAGNKVRAFPCCKIYLVHIFHTECTEGWLKRNKICPTCKTPCDAPRDYE